MADAAQSAASAPSLQALVRYQQQLDALCAATLRALSGQPGLHYRGRKLWRGQALLPSFAPHLHPKAAADAALAGASLAQPGVAPDAPLPDDLASFRGAADGVALRLRSSDPACTRGCRR